MITPGDGNRLTEALACIFENGEARLSLKRAKSILMDYLPNDPRLQGAALAVIKHLPLMERSQATHGVAINFSHRLNEQDGFDLDLSLLTAAAALKVVAKAVHGEEITIDELLGSMPSASPPHPHLGHTEQSPPTAPNKIPFRGAPLSDPPALTFTIVGTRNAGKTVYLSTLFGKGGDSGRTRVSPSEHNTIEYLRPMWSDLLAGKKLQATAAQAYDLAFRYYDGSRHAQFIIQDYDGYFVESLSAEQLEKTGDRSDFAKRIHQCAGLIVLFPYERKFDEVTQDNLGTQVNYIIDILARSCPADGSCRTPVIIGITKWDESQDFNAADEVLAAARFVEQTPVYCDAFARIRSFFETVEIVPISSVGMGYRFGRGGDVRPKNIVLPFEILISRFFHLVEEKADQLKSVPEDVVQYLATVYTDLQGWQAPHLVDLYTKEARICAEMVLSEIRKSSNKDEFEELRVKYKTLIYALRYLKTPDISPEIEAMARVHSRRLAQIQRIRTALIVRITTVTCIAAAVTLYAVQAWHIKNTEEALRHAIVLNSSTASYAALREEVATWDAQFGNRWIRLLRPPFLDWEGYRVQVHNAARQAAESESDEIAKRGRALRGSQSPPSDGQVNFLLAELDKLPIDGRSPSAMAWASEERQRIALARQIDEWTRAAQKALNDNQGTAKLSELQMASPMPPGIDPEIDRLMDALRRRYETEAPAERKVELERQLTQLVTVSDVVALINKTSWKDFDEKYLTLFVGLAAKKIEEIERSVVQEAPLQIEAVADLRRAESLIKVLDATFVTINAVFDPAWRRSSEPPSGFWEKMFRGNTNELNIYQRPKDISSFVDKEKKLIESLEKQIADGVDMSVVTLTRLTSMPTKIELMCTLNPFVDNTTPNVRIRYEGEILELPGGDARCKRGNGASIKSQLVWEKVSFRMRSVEYKFRIASSDGAYLEFGYLPRPDDILRMSIGKAAHFDFADTSLHGYYEIEFRR